MTLLNAAGWPTTCGRLRFSIRLPGSALPVSDELMVLLLPRGLEDGIDVSSRRIRLGPMVARRRRGFAEAPVACLALVAWVTSAGAQSTAAGAGTQESVSARSAGTPSQSARELPLPERIKHIPLNDDGTIWASVGGQIRERAEGWNGFNFGGEGDRDDTFLLSRLRLHGDVHFNEHVRVFVEMKSAFSTDRSLRGGHRTLDVDELDVENAYVDITMPMSGDTSLTFRPGRQGLLFGKQRLVSPLDWTNTSRTFQGGSAILQTPHWHVTAFWTRPVSIRQYGFNTADRDAQFQGLYASGRQEASGVELDLYWLNLDRNASAEHNRTIGARVGSIGGVTTSYQRRLRCRGRLSVRQHRRVQHQGVHACDPGGIHNSRANTLPSPCGI